jgi:predicted GNAT family acetyltransferase
MNTTPVKNNAYRHRFELDTDGKLSVVDYQNVDDETLALVHTEVDESLEGQGVGSHLVEGVLQYVEQNNLKIVAVCPFISTYLKRHPDWNRVVSTAYTTTGF